MDTIFYKVIFEPQQEGGFTAYCPKLPGCVSEGESYQETYDNIKEAIELYLQTLKDRNLEIFKDDIHISEIGIAV